MPESIRVFENSLRDYLLDVQTDSYNTQGKIQHKYNNLKVYMDPKRKSIPHFWVSANISANSGLIYIENCNIIKPLF